MTDLLLSVLSGMHDSFAVIDRAQQRTVDVYVGSMTQVDSLADIPLRHAEPGPGVLAAVPFRQISERGFTCHDDRHP
jgi:2-amino-4-deoxychorismate synthase